MAFKPSKARTHTEEADELDLTPYMNFVMILIPVIMASSEYTKLAMIPIDLPSTGPSSQAGDPNAPPPEEVAKLSLAVSITSQGFTITSEKARLPIIPLKGTEFDYEDLTAKLWALKQQVRGQFPDENDIVIASAQDVKYEVIIKTMDATRVFMEDGIRPKMMFPNVSLSPGIT
ncbi:MAG: hypothetical protein HOH43_16470 [Candidatus Latescibacteria bacterium]|jgi:biopolymer transport protein ExbD|nr:hypothetical protein [Candidatus Latescibacterota bacterium]